MRLLLKLHAKALCFALNIVELKKKSGGEAVIYAPNGDFSHCTILIYFKLEGMVSVTYYSETDEGCARLRDALAASNIFHDVGYLLITAVHDRVHRAVGTDWSDMQLDHITPCNLFSIPCEDALKLNTNCPDDVEVRNLRAEDAELINSLWPHRTDGSVNFIRAIIPVSPNVGLYRKSNNELLSWVLLWFYGGLGVLQTVEQAKRKGFGQIVVAALSKILARADWPIHATVLVNNHASTHLFNKMGFTNEFLCHYIEYSRDMSK